MDKLMIWLCEGLDACLNGMIVLLFVVELVLAVWAWKKLYALKQQVDSLYRLDTKVRGRYIKAGERKLSQTSEVVYGMDYARFDTIRVEYQSTEKVYSFFSLIIQLFPLLGILGTVAGLYIAIVDEMNIYEGVKFALSSTVYGIIFAVISKIIDIILVALYVNSINQNMERYEKNYMVYTEEAKNIVKTENNEDRG